VAAGEDERPKRERSFSPKRRFWEITFENSILDPEFDEYYHDTWGASAGGQLCEAPEPTYTKIPEINDFAERELRYWDWDEPKPYRAPLKHKPPIKPARKKRRWPVPRPKVKLKPRPAPKPAPKLEPKSEPRRRTNWETQQVYEAANRERIEIWKLYDPSKCKFSLEQLADYLEVSAWRGESAGFTNSQLKMMLLL
jgi:hypothetical protein